MDTLLSFIIKIAHANPNTRTTLPNPLGADTTIETVITRIFEWLSFTAGPILVTAMVVIGAYQMLFSGGDPEKFGKGKKTLIYTVIGYALLLMATGISKIIQRVLTGDL